jgi:hypothetical protein
MATPFSMMNVMLSASRHIAVARAKSRPEARHFSFDRRDERDERAAGNDAESHLESAAGGRWQR